MGVCVGRQERRSQKKSLTAANRVVRAGHEETTAAGCRNGNSGGEEECRVMLTDGLKTGNS
jgi:hypothetical protein